MPDTMTNQEQITQWNEKSGPKWVTMQARLDTQLEVFNRAMLDRVALRPGERVLDVGCGCGATTLDAAARVGDAGFSMGVDISRPMLERARERAASLRNVEFIEADAQVFAFAPSTFDAAVSRFGVMFFADPAAAFANIRRALKPEGRLCFFCWRPMNENPWVLVPLRAASQHLEMPPPPAPTAPGPFAFGDAERLRGILGAAGFDAVEIDRFDSPMAIGGTADLEESADFALNVGPVSALLQGKSEELRRAVRASLREALLPHLTPRGVELNSAAWLVTAQNP